MTASTLSERDAQAQLDAALADLAELEQRASGTVEHQTMRREQRQAIRQTGVV